MSISHTKVPAPYWEPRYETTGLCFNSVNVDAHFPQSLLTSAAPLKWVPPVSAIPQFILDKLHKDGGLSADLCEHFLSAKDQDRLRCWAEENHVSLRETFVEILPRTFSIAVRKDGTTVETFDISQRRAAVLFGRDRTIADVPIDHPSCSSQHAMVFSCLFFDLESVGESRNLSDCFDVDTVIVDLGSLHGTKVNDAKLSRGTAVALNAGDKINFAMSSRDYIVINLPAS